MTLSTADISCIGDKWTNVYGAFMEW